MDSKTDIPYDLLMKIQTGTMSYSYKGIETLKNPFDIALYSLLIWEQKPACILELGSWEGGGAVWLADQMYLAGIEPNVVSVDIKKIELEDPRVQFLQGDVYELEKTFTDEFLASLPRPFMVIEDADHSKKSTLAAMNFFADILQSGEYMLIEDGILEAMKVAEDYGGGPTAAIDSFLNDRPGVFEVDRRYCDYYGHNVTWNTNGFLKKL